MRHVRTSGIVMVISFCLSMHIVSPREHSCKSCIVQDVCECGYRDDILVLKIRVLIDMHAFLSRTMKIKDV